ncbi:MAG: hypothetical protein KAS12_06225, partial [Candidatus Aenigmarchaeota archaeon]|nr:hypothetical protein [Candidatus Aenigmarchaeota archaeon]
MVLISQKRIKGQSGLELLMLATFVLFAFSAAYITFMHNDINTVSEKINRLAKKTTDDVAFE